MSSPIASSDVWTALNDFKLYLGKKKPYPRPHMISEKIHLGLDIQELQKFFKTNVLCLPPVCRSKAVGGWSVQSASGSYQDGWQPDFLPYNGPLNQGPTWLPKTPEEEKWTTMQDCFRPTEIHFGYLSQVMNQVAEMGFHPRRARIIRLMAGTSCQWHQDGSSQHYQVRLHIPILTNSDCFFETETGRVHMPADGHGHLVHINRLHRVVNQGSTDRYHLVVNIWDTQGLSKNHQYNRPIGQPSVESPVNPM